MLLTGYYIMHTDNMVVHAVNHSGVDRQSNERRYSKYVTSVVAHAVNAGKIFPKPVREGWNIEVLNYREYNNIV